MKPALLDYELLLKARSFIDTKDKWLQGRTHNGADCAVREPTRFCTAGAVLKTIPSLAVLDDHPVWLYLMKASKELYDYSPIGVNDLHGYKATMKMWDYAIELAKKDAS